MNRLKKKLVAIGNNKKTKSKDLTEFKIKSINYKTGSESDSELSLNEDVLKRIVKQKSSRLGVSSNSIVSTKVESQSTKVETKEDSKQSEKKKRKKKKDQIPIMQPKMILKRPITLGNFKFDVTRIMAAFDSF